MVDQANKSSTNANAYTHTYNTPNRVAHQTASSSSSAASTHQYYSRPPTSTTNGSYHPSSSSSSAYSTSSYKPGSFNSYGESYLPTATPATHSSNRQLPPAIRQVVDEIARVPQNPRTGWPNRKLLGQQFPRYFSKKGVLRKGTDLHRYAHLINWPDWFWRWLEDCNGV